MEGVHCSSAVEALKPLVEANGWDYCIHWRLSSDQRFLEFFDYFCSETGHQFLNLDEVPSSIPLDSDLGAYEHILSSNQPVWHTDMSATFDSCKSETGRPQTRLLVPLADGVVELFAARSMAEKRQMEQLIMSQCAAAAHVDGEPSGWTAMVPPGQHSAPLDLFDGPTAAATNAFLAVTNAFMGDMAEFPQCSAGEQPAVLQGGGAMEEGDCDGSPENLCSDGTDEDDEDGDRPVRKGGRRRQQCKNLMAERRRRKKLNDRLYNLRSLVPTITKMDKASILGDAINYIVELQNQVKALEEELDGEGGGDHRNSRHILHSPMASAVIDATKKNIDQLSNDDDCTKGNEMEPQVEVRQMDGSEYLVQVLCEQRRGGFARLMSAMIAAGLEATSVNVTTYNRLALNVFRATRTDGETVPAERAREFFLSAMRRAGSGEVSPERESVVASAAENDSGNGDENCLHQRHDRRPGSSSPSYHHHYHHLSYLQ